MVEMWFSNYFGTRIVTHNVTVQLRGDLTRRQPDRAAAKSRHLGFVLSYPANIIRPNPDNTPIMYFGLLAFLFAAYLDSLRPMWSSLSYDELNRSALQFL